MIKAHEVIPRMIDVSILEEAAKFAEAQFSPTRIVLLQLGSKGVHIRVRGAEGTNQYDGRRLVSYADIEHAVINALIEATKLAVEEYDKVIA
jgi:hypothetical protein